MKKENIVKIINKEICKIDEKIENSIFLIEERKKILHKITQEIIFETREYFKIEEKEKIGHRLNFLLEDKERLKINNSELQNNKSFYDRKMLSYMIPEAEKDMECIERKFSNKSIFQVTEFCNTRISINFIDKFLENKKYNDFLFQKKLIQWMKPVWEKMDLHAKEIEKKIHKNNKEIKSIEIEIDFILKRLTILNTIYVDLFNDNFRKKIEDDLNLEIINKLKYYDIYVHRVEKLDNFINKERNKKEKLLNLLDNLSEDNTNFIKILLDNLTENCDYNTTCPTK